MAHKPLLKVEDIRSDVENGMYTVDMMKKYNCSNSTILKFCHKNGIAIPKKHTRAAIQGENVEVLKKCISEGMTTSQISSKYGWKPDCIRQTCLRENISYPVKPEHKRQRFLHFDYDFFKKIDTPEKAYVVGFIAADGMVFRKTAISIRLHPRDVDILEKIAKVMKCDYGVKITENGTRASLCLYNIDSVNDISRYGIVPNKTKTIPFALNIPEEFIGHYLRGIFDGDGSFDKKHRVMRLVTGSEIFFKGFISWFRNKYGYIPWNSCEEGTKWRIVFRKREWDFVDFVYGDAPIVLNRKKLIYEKNWSRQDIV